MPWTAGMATNNFSQNADGPREQFVRREQTEEFHSLFYNPRLVVGLFSVSAFMANFRMADHP
jgi:hypothetical protein